MYFVVKAVLRNLVLPPAGPLMVAILGALLMRRGRRIGGWLLGFGLAALWLLATPIVADAVWRMAEHYPPLDLTQPVGAQAIVILGGGGLRILAPEYQTPAPDLGLLERLVYGAHVARLTGLPILVTGQPTEVVAMSTTLSRDFAAAPRWVDDQSRDTYENARFSARLLRPEGIKRVILVTSSVHLFRASQEFRSAGFDVIPAPVGVWGQRETGAFRYLPEPAALLRSNLGLYELLGEPARRLQAALGLREFLDKKVAAAPLN